MADLRGLKTSIQKHATLWCARIATVRGVACYIGFSGGGFSKTKWEWGALQHSEKPVGGGNQCRLHHVDERELGSRASRAGSERAEEVGFWFFPG